MILLLQNELAATNQEVMLLTLELEQRVAERTAQLSKSNKALREEVAERKLAEEEVRKLNLDLEQRAAELQSVNQNLEAFSYSVSHDLRAPIRHIGGYTAMLRESLAGQTTDEIEQYLEAILRLSKKMGQLIDDLLQFSRMSRVQMTSSQVDFNQLVSAVVSDLHSDIEGRHIIWQIGELPVVYCDGSLLRHALTNLVSNALKYSRLRDPATIEIGWWPEKDRTIFFVKDNGVGFDPQFGDKLFGVFERLHSEREFEGTGIGLANVRNIIERHGGQTWAEGAVGKGATFYFSLPTHDLGG